MKAKLYINGTYSGMVTNIIFEQAPTEPEIFVNDAGSVAGPITVIFAAPACVGRQWPLWRVRNWWRRLRGLE